MIEWNIQSRAHACEACGKSFADQEAYHTLLFDERTGFRRLDICRGCWEKQYSEGARDRKGFVSYWQGVYELPPPPVEPIHKENAESLLRKLVGINDPRYVPAMYILAVMLERKRLLKVKEQVIREGQRVFIYEHPRTGDVFTVVDPVLQLSQLDAVQRDVAELLEHGLDSTATEKPTGESPTAEPAPPQEPAAAAEAVPCPPEPAEGGKPVAEPAETPAKA